MKWANVPAGEFEIRDLQHAVRDGELILTWHWPKGVDFVYIYKAEAGAALPAERLTEKDVKLYTREEYKAKKAYVAKADAIGRYVVRVFPCIKEGGALTVLKQEDANNSAFFAAGKAKIKFAINYKKKLFVSKKIAQMNIMTELPLDADVLCYVKKNGGPPSSPEDGTVYHFDRDFPAGPTALPGIEMDKNDYIRIFFTDGKGFAEIFELIPE